jgi:leucyl/phenylalanyl-tRNA---protein transferase
MPGLLAAGGALDVATLVSAYQHTVFPWFSEGQPILWWSTDPRMVLQTRDFRLHRSLAKTLAKFVATPGCEVRIDTAFADVIRHCAQRPRSKSASGSGGTWILPQMISAYEALHQAGFAHSVETWRDGELVGGLYGVALGHAVFGESMFSLEPDASKIALAALVALCSAQGVTAIDCQQNTRHLHSLGAREMPRADFAKQVAQTCHLPALDWQFRPVYWNEVLTKF